MVGISQSAGRAGQDFFLFHSVQTISGAYTACYPMGTWDSFPEVKRPGREADPSPPSTTKIKNGGAIPPLPICLY
jgi:hypothetical protein